MTDIPVPSPAPEKKAKPPKSPFKVGDVVYLKSGSSAMVVEQVDLVDGRVHVAWHHYETKLIIRDAFVPAVLKKSTTR